MGRDRPGTIPSLRTPAAPQHRDADDDGRVVVDSEDEAVADFVLRSTKRERDAKDEHRNRPEADSVLHQLAADDVPLIDYRGLKTRAEECANWGSSGSRRRVPLIPAFDVEKGLPQRHFLPAAARELLLPHQVEGVQFILEAIACRSHGCILADFMGLGKTLQAITSMSLLLGSPRLRKHLTAATHAAQGIAVDPDSLPEDDSKRVLRVVVMAPSGVCPGWMSEMRRFSKTVANIALHSGASSPQSQMVGGTAGLAVFVNGMNPAAASQKTNGGLKVVPTYEVRGDSRHDDKAVKRFRESGGVLVVPYSQFRIGILEGDGEGEDSSIEPDLVVLDEGHVARTQSSLLAAKLSTLKTRARLVLTGYPLQNNLRELYNMLDFCSCGRAKDPTVLGPFNWFDAFFMAPIERAVFHEYSNTKSEITDLPTRCLLRTWLLCERAAPYIKRRGLQLLSSIAPQRDVFRFTIAPTKAQAAAYNELCGGAALSAFALPHISQMLLLPLSNFWKSLSGRDTLTRRQVQDTSLFESDAPSPKMLFVFHLLGVARGRNARTIVFTQYHSCLDELESYNETLFPEEVRFRMVRCDGMMDVPTRVARCDAYNAGDADVLIFSLRAGCEGLNLPHTSLVIALDPCWNPAVQHEAFARGYRLGSRTPVEVLSLCVSQTVEVAVAIQQRRKESLAGAVIDRDAAMGAERMEQAVASIKPIPDSAVVQLNNQPMGYEEKAHAVHDLIGNFPPHSLVAEAVRTLDDSLLRFLVSAESVGFDSDATQRELAEVANEHLLREVPISGRMKLAEESLQFDAIHHVNYGFDKLLAEKQAGETDGETEPTGETCTVAADALGPSGEANYQHDVVPADPFELAMLDGDDDGGFDMDL